MEDLKGLSKEELRKRLKETEDDLQDLIDERDFSNKQVGLHVYADEVNAQRQAWEKDEKRYRERIQAINDMLDSD